MLIKEKLNKEDRAKIEKLYCFSFCGNFKDNSSVWCVNECNALDSFNYFLDNENAIDLNDKHGKWTNNEI